MVSHHLRLRYCGDCLNGHHALDSDSRRTDFLRLVRHSCRCEACDCTFQKVHIEEPRSGARSSRSHPPPPKEKAN